MFADRESADRAVRDLNGTELDGRKIFLRKVWCLGLLMVRIDDVIHSLPSFPPSSLSLLPPSSLSLSLSPSLPPSVSRLCHCACDVAIWFDGLSGCLHGNTRSLTSIETLF